MTEYQFDFSKMSIADLVFLSEIDGVKAPNSEQVKRLFGLLGRVTVGIDDIPAHEMAQLMEAMVKELVEYVKLGAMYGPVIMGLNFDEAAEPPTQGNPIGYNSCVRCDAAYPGTSTVCPNCGHDHDPSGHEQDSRHRVCLICHHEWYGTQMMCPECNKHD